MYTFLLLLVEPRAPPKGSCSAGLAGHQVVMKMPTRGPGRSAESKGSQERPMAPFALSGTMQSVWPSGLRRQLQVLFFFGRRGFEPLSGHFDAGKPRFLPRRLLPKIQTNLWPKLRLRPLPDPCRNYDIFRLLSSSSHKFIH